MSKCISTAQARTKCAPKLLWEARARFLHQDVVRSAPAAPGPCMTILWNSPRGPGMKILLKVLVWRSCGDPSEMLSETFAWPCTGPCAELLKRSWWNPVGVLTWSGAGPCAKILWRSCWNPPQGGTCIKILKTLWIGACMKGFSGMLIGSSSMKILFVSSSIKIYIEAPAAAVAILSNLICFSSIATVACIYYIDFLPPTLFGSCCRCSIACGHNMP